MRWSNAGSPGIAKLNVPSPVSESSPRKISVPMPAASRPGTSTRPSIGPPRPDASSSRNAPISGEPSSELIAAKLPVAAITAAAVGGASRDASRTASTPSPLPIRISGASGPRTAPRASVARAAKKMPGSSTGGTGPDALKPSAGECPPMPGRCRIASATSRPDSASSGSGHHTGAESNPSVFGRSLKRASCSQSASARNP